jgi:DNA-binding protein HU-beta
MLRVPPHEREESTMNKTELAGQIAERAGVSATQAGRVLDATLQSIEAALAAGDEVSITGFGKFSVANRAPRQGVNPATGEPMAIAASKAPRFSAGSRLKEAVKA